MSIPVPPPKEATRNPTQEAGVTSTTPTKVRPEPPGLVANQIAELLFNTMVIYGPTGSHKTMSIGDFAKYIYEKTGKKTRLISMDGGGWAPIQDYINAGIIDPWRMVEEPSPRAAIIKASRGAWPDSIKNGLRASSTITEPSQGNRAKALKDVGAYAIEGWSSISTSVMRDMVSKDIRGSEDVVEVAYENLDGSVLAGQELALAKKTGHLPEGSEKFGAPSRSHYGLAHNFMLDMIRNFGALPLERILYTSLEGRGQDKITKALVYGPDVVGQAMTFKLPTLVGDCLHFEDYTENKGEATGNPGQKLVEVGVRIWFTQHPDAQTGAMWPAKPRVVGAKYDEFRKRLGKDGYFLWKRGALAEYLRIQDELLSSASNELREWKAAIDAARQSK
jgi:hypothetical protein